MNFNPMLSALGGGVGGIGGAATAVSPLLAMLLAHKKNGGPPVMATPTTPAAPTGSPLDGGVAPTLSNPSLAQVNAGLPQLPNFAADAQRRKQIGLSLMQLGPQFLGSSPFGYKSY